METVVGMTVYEWSHDGYPYEGLETRLFATEEDAHKYCAYRGEGQVLPMDIEQIVTP